MLSRALTSNNKLGKLLHLVSCFIGIEYIESCVSSVTSEAREILEIFF
jgi:hypothetical protein